LLKKKQKVSQTNTTSRPESPQTQSKTPEPTNPKTKPINNEIPFPQSEPKDNLTKAQTGTKEEQEQA
jgi:hypothetical protein